MVLPALNNARLGDRWVGICVCHPTPIPMTGTILRRGAKTVIAQGKPKARFGDITSSSCGHKGVIVTASGFTRAEKKNDARITDLVTGCNIGVIVSGASKVKTA